MADPHWFVVVVLPSQVFLIPGGYTLYKLYRCVPQVVWFLLVFLVHENGFCPLESQNGYRFQWNHKSV